MSSLPAHANVNANTRALQACNRRKHGTCNETRSWKHPHTVSHYLTVKRIQQSQSKLKNATLVLH